MGGFERNYDEVASISVSPCARDFDRECIYPLVRENYTEQTSDLSEQGTGNIFQTCPKICLALVTWVENCLSTCQNPIWCQPRLVV